MKTSLVTGNRPQSPGLVADVESLFSIPFLTATAMSFAAYPSLDELNALHGLAGQLRFVSGPGGFPLLEIRNPQASALVSLYGGQVLSFQPAGASDDVLFLSERAQYQWGKAIRGGVPVCWPWFGPDPEGKGRPSHGLARTRLWVVQATGTAAGGATQVSLSLTDTAETRALWPHAFSLRLDITIGTTLCLALSTRNTGTIPFTLTQALHSYFTVGDIARTTVKVLDGCRYMDKATGATGATKHQNGLVDFAGEVDRVYLNPPPSLVVMDGAGQRQIRIDTQGSRSAVVWNPGPEIAAGMADLDNEAYRRFVCVETTNAGDDMVTLGPGGEHQLLAEIGCAQPLA
jgi:glucose-6-phosphate 1-epimerase